MGSSAQPIAKAGQRKLQPRQQRAADLSAEKHGGSLHSPEFESGQAYDRAHLHRDPPSADVPAENDRIPPIGMRIPRSRMLDFQSAARGLVNEN